MGGCNLSERKREEKKEESGIVVVGKVLAPQLGSDQKHLVEQEIDQRKFAVLNELCQAAMGHFAYRAQVGGVRYFDRMIEWELNSSPSVGGLGRRQAIQMVNAAAGGGKSSLDVAEKPSWISRNVSKRDWKEKATKEGKVVVE